MIRIYQPCEEKRDSGRTHNKLDRADEWGKVNTGEQKRKGSEGMLRAL